MFVEISVLNICNFLTETAQLLSMCKSRRKKYAEGEVTPQIESNSVYYNCLCFTPVLILAIRDSGSTRNVIGGRLVCHPKTVGRCDALIRNRVG